MSPRAPFAAALAAGLFSAAAFPAAAEDACPPAPAPIVTLSYSSRYAPEDPSRATLDPDRLDQVEAALAPLDAFVEDLSNRSEALYSGGIKSRLAAADCILAQLAAWARAGALTDLGTETVRLTVGARYAAFGMILWQTLPYAPDSPDRKAALDWLAARLDSQRAWWGEAPPGAQVGNLRAWAALAAAALSVQTNRTGLRDWAAASLIEVLCTANPDGSLPQEMSRDKFALHYQLHAVAPLVTAAALLERQGVDVRDTCGGALHRVAGFAAADLTGGAKTKAITGVRQSFFDGTETLDPFQLAWIEPYLALWDDPAMDALAKPLRPLSYSKLGGDQTLIWGR